MQEVPESGRDALRELNKAFIARKREITAAYRNMIQE